MESEWGRGCCINSISWWQKGLEFCRGQPIKINSSTYFHLLCLCLLTKNLTFILSIIQLRTIKLTKLGWKSFTKHVIFLVLDFLTWQSIGSYNIDFYFKSWYKSAIEILFLNFLDQKLWCYESMRLLTYIQINYLYNF